MENKRKFPDGTQFTSEYAFVPKPDGSGVKMVKITKEEYKQHLSDRLIDNNEEVEEDTGKIANKDISFDISFDISYDEILNDEEILKDEEIKKQEPVTKKEAFENKKPAVRKAYKKSGNNIHAGHRERMRERYEKEGLDSFAGHEVLEMLLYFAHERKNTNDIAHMLINEFGSLENVFKADIHDLKTVNGVGDKSAFLINFFNQLTTYMNSYRTNNTPLPNSSVMGDFCRDYFKGRTKERFIVLILDTTRTLQNIVVISEGTENETAYYPRNVLKAAIQHKANLVAIAHNHTGNCNQPSENDICISNEIAKLLNGIGVPLIDHIICAGGSYISLSDRGFIRE